MRIALFYFFYLAAPGVTLHYFPKYLHTLKFSEREIASVMTLSPVLSIFVPLIWGFWADRTGRHTLLLKCAVMGAFLALIPLNFVASFWGVLGAWSLYMLFSAPILPMTDSLAIVEARRIGTDFSRLRLWGSISFIITSFGFGVFLKYSGQDHYVPLATMSLLFFSCLAVHLLQQPAHAPRRIPPSFKDARKLIGDPALFWFFITMMVHQAALSPFYLYFSIYLDKKGLGQDIVGWSSALGVGAEVTMFYLYRPVFQKLPLFPILALSFGISLMRWLLMAWVNDGLLIILLQTAHAFTFALCYAGAISYLEHHVADPLRATGRALFAAISQGLGSVLGHQLAGYMSQHYGYGASFQTAAALEVVALLPLFLAARFTARKALLAEKFEAHDLDEAYPSDE